MRGNFLSQESPEWDRAWAGRSVALDFVMLLPHAGSLRVFVRRPGNRVPGAAAVRKQITGLTRS